ncbi:ATP-binding cassette sub-family C member 9-like [Lytechinus pictus]|uniref:ATP-binding cassette sub-family C member 9-like n=1 Tax=Lytechinus pictus TaxID=7653 RepID=UPI0030BA0B8A
MEETEIEKFDWFCGENASSTDSLYPFSWDLTHTIYNACFTDLLVTCLHGVFILLFSLVLIFVRCCNARTTTKHPYVTRYPGHVFRWFIYVAYMTLCICKVGEGVLTDIQTLSDQETSPRLYVAPTAALVMSILAAVYYHHMEYWDVPSMIVPQVVYWFLLLAAECIRFETFFYYYPDEITFGTLRWDLNIASIALVALICLTELHAIRIKILKWCTIEEGFPADLKDPKMNYYEGYCNLPSSVFFWWLNSLFKMGYDSILEIKDLGNLNKTHTVHYNGGRFAKVLAEEQAKAKATGKDMNLYWVYLKAFYPGLIRGGIIKFFGDTSSFLSPYLISGAIAYATANSFPDAGDKEPQTDKYIDWYDFFTNGFVLVVVLFIQSIFQRLCNQHHYHNVIMESAHSKAALQAAVYSKALRLSSYSMTGGSMTMGQITNHMSVDATNILNSFQWIHYIWSIPYLVIGYLVILYFQLGVASLIGSSIFLFSIPLQTLIAKKTAQYQKGAMTCADSRLKQTNEMLQGIKLIKLYAWEDIFLSSIGGARADEIWQLVTQNIWKVILNGVSNSAPLLVMLTSYSLYTVLTGLPLTPDITFAALSVFNQMSLPLFLLPMIFTFHVNAVVSTRRLSVFFTAPEVEDKDDGRRKEDGDSYQTNGTPDFPTNSTEVPNSRVVNPRKEASRSSGKEDTYRLLRESDDDLASSSYDNPVHRSPINSPHEDVLSGDVILKVTDGNFTWDNTSTAPILSGIQLELHAGQLTMIVGQVGSGKSSLLSAVLGEMTTLQGEVRWNREQSTIAYAAQKAWLINASLKENIVFGNQFSADRYEKVIKACCLQPDIDILPAGDETEIGEKGINLSGGQKQRVSVARAMYSYNNVVILDDPLSALDVHVGSDMFYKGIMEFLIENQRTVILVTHQIQYLEHADQVIYMKDGLIGHQGTMKEIGAKDANLMSLWNVTIKEITESEPESEDETKTAEERKKLIRSVSQTEEVKMKQAGKDKDSGKIIEKEERMLGSVSMKYYWYYIQAFGPFAFIVIFILALAQNAAQAATNFWLSAWSDAGANITGNDTKSQSQAILDKYLGGYAGLSVANIVISLIWSTILLINALYTARIVHNVMLQQVIHAPLRFFDTTPIGRVLNRFASDIQVMDQRMGQLLVQAIKFTLAAIAGVIVNTIISWYFVVAILPVAIFYVLLMKLFIKTSRELQRLESISRSPIFAYFSETLGGLPTIRAYSLNNRFQRNILRKIETNNTAFIYLQTGNRWLGVRLDTIGAMVVFLAGMSSLAASAISPETFGPSLVGLAITYAMSIAGLLNWVIRCAADLEMAMNAVERINFYSEIDIEDYDGSVIPASSWPDDGHILFDNVSARYARELDPVLKKVSVHFKAGEKIGICGRTGSGKSSLTLTLFRIIDMFHGEIVIDGINITRIPLKELRTRLAIIPQDPVLFTGTIRFNLDPMGDRTDDEVWQSLEIAQLKGVVTELNLGLDSNISEGGENFSVGQRQLFCLARAFLRKTKILVMDEATASIDFETDRILQEVVATAFQDRTVLTIAHRVATIMDADRILVLADGVIEEYGTPEALLAKENGIFASLVQSGK